MPRSIVDYAIGFSRRTESVCSLRSTRKCHLASCPTLATVRRRLIVPERPDCLGLLSKTLLAPLCPSPSDKFGNFGSYSPLPRSHSVPVSDLLFGEQAVRGGCTPATCGRFRGAGPIATSWYFLNNLFCCTVVLLLFLLISSLMVVSDAVEAPLLPDFAITMQSSARNTELEREGADPFPMASSSTTLEPRISSCRLLPTQRRAEQLCSVGPRVRLQQLRHLHWAGGVGAGARCPDLTTDLSLYHLFQLNVLNEGAVLEDRRSSARRQLDHLSDNVIDCLLGAARTKSCVHCFEALFRRLRLVDSVFAQFSNAVMASLSCESGNLDRFSSVTTCTDCQVWYKRWLLATFANIWRLPLCYHWCHMVELACPHLSVRRRYDYAGLPSFRCADPSVPAYKQKMEQELHDEEPSKCIHPCDLLPESAGSFSSLFCRSSAAQQERPSSVAESIDEAQAIRASGTASSAARVETSVVFIVMLLSVITLHVVAGHRLRYHHPGFG